MNKSFSESTYGILIARGYNLLCVPEIKTIDDKPPEDEKNRPITFWHVYFIGIAMKIGACTVIWHMGTSAGFWEHYIGFLICSIGYFMFALCMAEMMSIMSFSGGYYGYARCALGPLGGFLVGCSGFWESLTYFSIYIRRIGQAATIVFDLEKSDSVPMWIVIVIMCCTWHLLFHKYFWATTIASAIGALGMLLAFLFGSMKDLDFEKWASYDSTGMFTDSTAFMECLKLSVVFYLGFDMITLTSSEVREPKKNIPRVLIALVCTIFVLATWTMVTTVSQYPGVCPKFYSSKVALPLWFGHSKLYNISQKQATIIVIMYPVVSALTYLHILSKQLKAMASSGLMPAIFKITFGPYKYGLYHMAFISFVTVYLNYFSMKINKQSVLLRETAISGCFVYIAMFYCFYVFRRRFSHLERSFRSPLGLIGAFLGAMIFIFILFVLLYYQEKQFYPVTVMYFSYIAFMFTYYYLWVESHQYFSATEQKVFFKAYILNMQIRKKKAVHHRFAHDMMNIFHIFGKRGSHYSINSGSEFVNSHSGIHSVDGSVVKPMSGRSDNSKNAINHHSVTGTVVTPTVNTHDNHNSSVGENKLDDNTVNTNPHQQPVVVAQDQQLDPDLDHHII